LEALDGVLVVRATNLEAGIEIEAQANTESSGVVAVSAAVLSQTVRSIGGDTVTLKTQDGNLSVESRGSKNLIKAIPHEEFPALGGKTKSTGFNVSRMHLIAALQAVVYAASPSMIRPELGSVYVSFDGGAIIAVATDSFRLAEKKIARTSKKESGEFLIPVKHAAELMYVLERIAAEEVMIIPDEAQLTVEGAGVRFMSRLVDGQFPNYKEIVPKKFATEATILKNDLVEILRKARVFSGNDQHLGFHLYPKRKLFSATARSAEIGEMSDSIDAALSGDDLDINFHIGYLADCLSSIQSDSIALKFAGPGRPLVVGGTSDASFMYLVMPLNR
ncbi:MAG TPA: DNA polymerase III subunit beta, partial [Candidatus Paceibacterota bacterium]|nr:DNA polymerase III subunit beta [Candidatus Paceibacterota bacterium]